MNFTVVILSEYISMYQGIDWNDWKDRNRKQIKGEGDNWSQSTLSGKDIWDCLDTNKIDRRHLVQWKPIDDVLCRVSLLDQLHPIDTTN